MIGRGPGSTLGRSDGEGAHGMIRRHVDLTWLALGAALVAAWLLVTAAGSQPGACS